jgi:hypothetical protein
MTIGFIFYLLMLLWLVLSLFWYWPPAPPYHPLGNAFFLFILLLLLGIGVFGSPIRGL